jgi:hypothetical protein
MPRSVTENSIFARLIVFDPAKGGFAEMPKLGLIASNNRRFLTGRFTKKWFEKRSTSRPWKLSGKLLDESLFRS